MCDYSLQSTQSRPAKVGDKLTTHNFGTGTRGFATAQDPTTAVCVLPGTEIAFSREVALATAGIASKADNAIAGIRDKPIAPGSPWQNGFAERLIGSIRRACTDYIVVRRGALTSGPTVARVLL
jgi:hypothetical protein